MADDKIELQLDQYDLSAEDRAHTILSQEKAEADRKKREDAKRISDAVESARNEEQKSFESKKANLEELRKQNDSMIQNLCTERTSLQQKIQICRTKELEMDPELQKLRQEVQNLSSAYGAEQNEAESLRNAL